MNRFENFGIAVPEILMPSGKIEKWATIACDQHTSEQDYWEEVEKIKGKEPSSLDLMMPEAWLKREEKKAHQEKIPKLMKQYIDDGTLKNQGEGFVFVQRKMSNGQFRRGLIVLLDLEKYDYVPGNKALCRATEGVVEDRLPTRIEIRKKAALEMPHVMVLFNDKHDILMGQLEILVRNREPLYDAELMMGGGKIKGWFIQKEQDLELVAKSLETLLKEAKENQDGMLYAVGDGNHSLAAAKKCGDKYAMVELVNINDSAVEFHPIHKLLDKDGNVADYIHGEEECKMLAKKLGLKALIMPPFDKQRLFTEVIANGVLPKKSFSIGNAVDKRYYLECRALKNNAE